MSKLVQAFPQVRLAIYGIASATLAGLVIAGVVTEGQSSNILNYVGLGLGALATLLAGLNVSKPSAADQSTASGGANGFEVILTGAGGSIPGVNDVISQGIQQVEAAITPSVDQIRAQLEQQLGRRTEG
ncbi:hypothetical protein QNA24_12255 [Rhodococcus qingshengii]|uniref:hypothetical protein n=1 Tax=Rhodococcus qingshengii TaxID=334542 RepID=UPI0024B9F06F|nr:hypothetical protein [Rhodococcus qingshengii]MDJ0487132.1 hypothetical protein [Rhodococcus qingshengii]